MNNLTLIWGCNELGGSIKNPKWGQIAEKLGMIEAGEGTVTLDYVDAEDRQKSLQVRFENKRFLLTYGFETSDDWVVRAYISPDGVQDDSMEELLGDRWRSAMVFSDLSIIKAAFAEFFEVGSIEAEWSLK